MHNYREKDLFPPNVELEYERLENNLEKFKEKLLYDGINVMEISTKDLSQRIGDAIMDYKKTITIHCFIEKITTIKTYVFSYNIGPDGASKDIKVYDAQMQFMSPDINDYLTINAIKKVIKRLKDDVEERFDVNISPYTYITKEKDNNRIYYINSNHRIIRTPDVIWVLDKDEELKFYFTHDFNEYNAKAETKEIKKLFQNFSEYIDSPQKFKYDDGVYLTEEKLVEDIEKSSKYNYYNEKIKKLNDDIDNKLQHLFLGGIILAGILNTILFLITDISIITSTITIAFLSMTPLIAKTKKEIEIEEIKNTLYTYRKLKNTSGKSYIFLKEDDSLIRIFDLDYFQNNVSEEPEADTTDNTNVENVDYHIYYFGDDEQFIDIVKKFNKNAAKAETYFSNKKSDSLLEFYIPKLKHQVSIYDNLSRRNKHIVRTSVIDANQILIDELKEYKSQDEIDTSLDIQVLHDQIKAIKDNR